MAFVTDDKRVKNIVAQFKAGKMTHGEAATAIRHLPPQQDKDGKPISEFGYLDWEVDAALNSARAKP